MIPQVVPLRLGVFGDRTELYGDLHSAERGRVKTGVDRFRHGQVVRDSLEIIEACKEWSDVGEFGHFQHAESLDLLEIYGERELVVQGSRYTVVVFEDLQPVDLCWSVDEEIAFARTAIVTEGDSESFYVIEAVEEDDVVIPPCLK